MVDLLVIRHAIAEEKEAFAKTGRPDSLRPLTAAGKKKMGPAADGLHALVDSLDVLATSPYTRAAQTAEIVAKRYKIDVEETPVLEPGAGPAAVAAWVRKRVEAGLRDGAPVERVAVVGHEPDLGELVSWLIAGTQESHVELKKGAACLVRFESGIARGEGVLRWLLTASMLGEMAG